MGRITFKSKPKQLLRLRVFERDGFRCCQCGWRPGFIPSKYNGSTTIMDNGKWLEVDHIKPVSRGGSNHYSNLQTLCNKCNCSKGVN